MLDISSLRTGDDGDHSETPWDVAIVGGGPAGSTAALYAARSKLKTVVLDKNVAAGALAVTSKIANYPGIPGVIAGGELLRIMREQAESFGAEFVNTQVVSADLLGKVKELHTAAGIYEARTVIVATGKMGRKNKIAGEEEYLGRGVSYCAVCDGAFFQGQRVAVIGSSEEAVEDALLLTQFARELYLVAPGEKLLADRQRVEQLEADPKVKIRRNQALKEVLGDDTVAGVRLSGRGGEETLEVEGVFIYLPGNAPIVDFLGGVLELTDQGCVIVDRERATNVPGVYAVGDVICSYVQQAVVAAADGAIAAMAAERYLRGRRKPRSDWSGPTPQ